MKSKVMTFEQIAGYKEEKKELQNICYLIKEREKLMKAGGKMPKGLLLVGPSGVGKTMFAKAFINEASCPCVEINYNDCVSKEDFGDYIKTQFESAVNQAPCILFIDGIDKLVGQISPFGSDDNVNKGNIILTELNKYSDVEGLFVLMVSGRSGRFDKSLVRSGRVDRVINIEYPSEKEREEIVEFYCQNKKLDSDISYKKISKMFKGFTGADIESVLNNSVIKAFTRHSESISYKDVNDAYYDMLFKNSMKDVDIPEEELEALAYHEAGHAVIGLLSDPDSVSYASIKPRGNFMGFVNREISENKSTTFEAMRNDVCISLAGRAAEETFLNIKSTGCISDLAKAKAVITSMFRTHGMMGLRYLDNADGDSPFGPPTSASGVKLAAIEKAEDEMLDDMFELTYTLLHEYSNLFKDVVDMLKANRSITKMELEKLTDDYHLKEIDSNKYRIVKQRIGMFNRINQLDLQKNFSIGYYQADLILKKLIKDKLVSDSFGSAGYRVIAN